MKSVAKILLFLAGAILMLHSFLPHQHHDEMNNQQHFEAHQSAGTLLDFIKLAFHLNLGEDHLEDFQTAKKVEIDAVPWFLVPEHFSFEPSVIEDPEYILYSSDPIILPAFLDHHIRFRGPPNYL